jgi:hypothetical protein
LIGVSLGYHDGITDKRMTYEEPMTQKISIPGLSRWHRVVALSLTLCSATLAGCDDQAQPPYLNKFLVEPSPRGTYEATFYNYGKGGSGFLGATVSSAMYVNVRRRDEPFDPDKGQVFAMRHGYRLRLVWKDDEHLRVDYTSSAAVEKQQEKIGTVSIVFKPVSQNSLPEPYTALPQPKSAQ